MKMVLKPRQKIRCNEGDEAKYENINMGYIFEGKIHGIKK